MIGSDFPGLHVGNHQGGISRIGNFVAGEEPLKAHRCRAAGRDLKSSSAPGRNALAQGIGDDVWKFAGVTIEIPAQHNVAGGAAQSIDRDCILLSRNRVKNDAAVGVPGTVVIGRLDAQ